MYWISSEYGLSYNKQLYDAILALPSCHQRSLQFQERGQLPLHGSHRLWLSSSASRDPGRTFFHDLGSLKEVSENNEGKSILRTSAFLSGSGKMLFYRQWKVFDIGHATWEGADGGKPVAGSVPMEMAPLCASCLWPLWNVRMKSGGFTPSPTRLF